MGVATGFVFLGVEFVFIILCLLAIVRTGFVRLNSSVGIARDGFPPGKAVPSWSLPDVERHLRITPTGTHWQFLIFTDHSLVSFPELIVGMKSLVQQTDDLEVLILSRDDIEICKAIADGLEQQIPVVPVDQTFYDRFRVRVIPFAFLLDPGGIVYWVGLAKTEAQLLHAWRMAQATTYAGNA